MPDASIELEETLHSPHDFKSIQPAAAAEGQPGVST